MKASIWARETRSPGQSAFLASGSHHHARSKLSYRKTVTACGPSDVFWCCRRTLFFGKALSLPLMIAALPTGNRSQNFALPDCVVSVIPYRLLAPSMRSAGLEGRVWALAGRGPHRLRLGRRGVDVEAAESEDLDRRAPQAVLGREVVVLAVRPECAPSRVR